MIDSAIFDVDGTLFDSMHIWRDFGVHFLVRHGKKPDTATERAVRYMSLRQAAEHFKNDCGIGGSVEEIEADANRMLEEYYFNEIRLKSGVRELLCTLAERGVRMAIATATDRYLVEAALKREKVFDFFCGISTCPEVGSGKDKPDVFFASENYLTGVRESIWVFEDALHAVKTAKKAGFRVCAVYDETENDHRTEICALSDIYTESFEGFDTDKLFS